MAAQPLRLLFPLYHKGYFSREALVSAWRSDGEEVSPADVRSLVEAYARRSWSPYFAAKLHAERALPEEEAIRQLSFVYKADRKLLLPGQYNNPLQHKRQTPDGRWYTLFSIEI